MKLKASTEMRLFIVLMYYLHLTTMFKHKHLCIQHNNQNWLLCVPRPQESNMEQKIKALREAGFTDADIELYVNDEKSRQGQPQAVSPAQVDNSQPPIVDERVPAYGAPPGTSMLEGVATVGAAVAPYALPAAGVLAAGIGGSKIYKGWKAGTEAAQALAKSQAEQAAAMSKQAAADRVAAQGIQQRFEQRMAQQATQMPKPTATMPGTPNFGAGAPGTAMPTNPYQMPTAGPVSPQPAPMPSAPATAPAATPRPNMIQRGTDIANQMRQFAAQRVIPAMGQAGQMAGRGLSAVANSPLTRVGGTIANAAYSGDLNTGEQQELERRRKMSPTITRKDKY
jgi:hypothetical protein